MELCRQRLSPLGICSRQVEGKDTLPFADASFDLILNRHGNYDPTELCRLLRPGGFWTSCLCPFRSRHSQALSWPHKRSVYGSFAGKKTFRPIRFWDVGALVWFDRVLPREFPGFSVNTCRNQLSLAQSILEQNSVLEGTIHRYLPMTEKTAQMHTPWEFLLGKRLPRFYEKKVGPSASLAGDVQLFESFLAVYRTISHTIKRDASTKVGACGHFIGLNGPPHLCSIFRWT